MNRFAAIALMLAGLTLASRAAMSAPLLVQTQSGAVQGVLTADGTAQRWLGIPYAEPPTGERRWRAPQPHAHWSEVLKADKFGSPCAQVGSIYGPPPVGKPWGAANVETFGKPVGSEDCLTLNVWRPNRDEVALPVIVFIHGGAGIAGYAGDPMYEGSHLANAANAIVITINMRLGIFSSFLHPALASEDSISNSGNFGALDIIEALRFVHDNAAAFGGDPANVTLIGQSAGAIAVYGMMASPLASGLFHKAIVMSGLIGDGTSKDSGTTFSADIVAGLLVHDGLAKTPKTASQFVADKGPAWTRQYLLSKSTTELLDYLYRENLWHKIPGGFTDGIVVPADVKATFVQGSFNRVPTMIGSTRDEAKLMAGVFKLSDEQRFKLMLASSADAAPLAQPEDLIKGYLLPSLGSGLYNGYASMITKFLEYAVNSSIKRIAAHEQKVFVYRFDWDQAPEPWKTVYGAAHAIDLPFVFGNFSNNFFSMDFGARNRAGREALSQLMINSIAAFIRTGDPNNPDLAVKWSPWSEDSPKRLIFNASDSNASVLLQ